MSDNILITTTVGLDCDVSEPQKVIHLVQGDYGTRALRLVPVSGGRLIDMDGVASAKVRMSCSGLSDLLIDCTLGDHYAELVPTEAMVDEAEEWTCQLVLLDESNYTISSAPFTLIVHGTVYQGDAVEHTSDAVVSVSYDEDGKIVLELASGETVSTATAWTHTHDEATASAAGFMSAADKTALDTLADRVDQGVKTTDSPTFHGLTVGSLTIDESGNISGATFT